MNMLANIRGKKIIKIKLIKLADQKFWMTFEDAKTIISRKNILANRKSI